MSKAITIAVGYYDRTRPLIDGSIRVEGFETHVASGDLEEIFSQAFTSAPHDVTELSFSNFLIASSRGECPYLALPIFPSRSFRHSAIYIRSDRGIRSPVDLRGKRIGSREYSNTASMVVRGILSDEYGFIPGQSQWVIGDVDHVERQAIDESRRLERDTMRRAHDRGARHGRIRAGALKCDRRVARDGNGLRIVCTDEASHGVHHRPQHGRRHRFVREERPGGQREAGNSTRGSCGHVRRE